MGHRKKWPKYLGETLSNFNSCLDLPSITDIKRRVSEKKTLQTCFHFALILSLHGPKLQRRKMQTSFMVLLPRSIEPVVLFTFWECCSVGKGQWYTNYCLYIFIWHNLSYSRREVTLTPNRWNAWPNMLHNMWFHQILFLIQWEENCLVHQRNRSAKVVWLHFQICTYLTIHCQILSW